MIALSLIKIRWTWQSVGATRDILHPQKRLCLYLSRK